MAMWKHIDGTGKKYSVSDTGEVRRNIYRKILKVQGRIVRRSMPAKVLKPYLCGNHLHITYYTDEGKKKIASVARLVATAFVRPKNGAANLHYRNLDPNDTRASNLAWREEEVPKSPLANKEGENNPCSKLNEAAVIQIRKSNESTQELAVKYGLTFAAIRNVINRKTWKHVEAR